VELEANGEIQINPICKEDIRNASNLVLSQDDKYKSILLREKMLRE
jgi:hypothetical protein